MKSSASRRHGYQEQLQRQCSWHVGLVPPEKVRQAWCPAFEEDQHVFRWLSWDGRSALSECLVAASVENFPPSPHTGLTRQRTATVATDSFDVPSACVMVSGNCACSKRCLWTTTRQRRPTQCSTRRRPPTLGTRPLRLGERRPLRATTVRQHSSMH